MSMIAAMEKYEISSLGKFGRRTLVLELVLAEPPFTGLPLTSLSPQFS